MHNFGNLPPRRVESRGVASLLGENCRVYYDTLFSAAAIGRVSDLISARLREQKLDDLSLRALLLFGFFEAQRAQSLDSRLDKPVVLECGIDDEKIAIGVAFALRDPSLLQTEGLSERVAGSATSNPFERLLSLICAQSDHAILRVNRDENSVEIVSFLALPGKMTNLEKQPLVVVESKGASPPSPQAKEYVQLGDLDFVALLKEKREAASPKKAFSTGDFGTSKSDANGLDSPSHVRIAADPEEKSGDVRIASDPAQEKDLLVRIEGDQPKDEQPATRFSMQKVLGKVWPFKKKADEAEKNSEKAESDEIRIEGVREPQGPTKQVVESLSIPQFDNDDIKGMAQYVNSNISAGGFSVLVEKAQEFAREMKKEPGDSPAKRWAESFNQEIMAEKIRLVEISKNLNKAIRQKELESKNREQQFADDLRRKEEALHQKGATLAHVKEQLAQLSAQFERQKSGKGSASEDGNFKQKYQLSQRMVTSLREEITRLTGKLEEAKVQANSSQKMAESTAQLELANLKTKHDQVVRQSLQLKNMNEQLMRRVQKASAKNEKAERNSAAIEEMRKKLESATTSSEAQTKEIESLKSKLDQANKEQGRLARELFKKDVELRKMQSELDKLQKEAGAQKKAG